MCKAYRKDTVEMKMQNLNLSNYRHQRNQSCFCFNGPHPMGLHQD